MAEPYMREPVAPVSGTPGESVRVSESIEDRTAHYQAEIEHLKADVAKLAQTVSNSVRDTMKPMARELETVVARHPTASVTFAAGLGLLLGYLMSRK